MSSECYCCRVDCDGTRRRHTSSVTSALLTEALAPLRADPARAAILLDIDGTLAPIVEHAADAHVPETTRQLLIEVARRYGVVACVQRPPGLGGAGDGRRSARSPTSARTAPSCCAPGGPRRCSTRASRIGPRRIHEFAREADTADLRRRRVRIEDKGAIVAFHWRGAPDEEAARAAIDAIAAAAEAAGLRTHWGRKVLEVRPPVRIDKGAGIASVPRGSRSTPRCTSATTSPISTRSGRWSQLVDERTAAQAISVGVRSDEGPAAITEEADIVVDGTDGVARAAGVLLGWRTVRFADFLRTTVLISAAAASALAAVTVAGAGGTGDNLVVPFAAGWWVLAGRDRRLARAPRRDTSQPIASLLASARTQRRCPRSTRPHRAQPAVAAAAVSRSAPARSRSSCRRCPAVATGFAIIWALAWRRQASAVTAIEERDGARFYVERTSPLQPIKLVRTPGFRSNLFELNGHSGRRPARPRT